MNWISCHNIFLSLTQEGAKRQVRFASPLTKAVGEFARNVNAVPEDRRFGFWNLNGGLIQKWAQEELFNIGYSDQRFKFKKLTHGVEVEFMTQNLTSGTPLETMGQDTVESVLQALHIAIMDM